MFRPGEVLASWLLVHGGMLLLGAGYLAGWRTLGQAYRRRLPCPEEGRTFSVLLRPSLLGTHVVACARFRPASRVRCKRRCTKELHDAPENVEPRLVVLRRSPSR